MKKHNSFGYVLAALGVTLLGLIIVFVTVTFLSSGYNNRIAEDSEDIIARTAEMAGSTIDTDVINRKIDSGLMSTGDYVVSAMTSAEYLLSGKDDEAFASDVAYILYGSIDDKALIEKISASLTSRSRR